MIHYSMCVCACVLWFLFDSDAIVFFPILFISCWSSFNLQQTKSWDLHCQHQRHRSLSPLSFIMSASTTPQADLCSCKFWQLQKLADTANNNVNLRTHILIKQDMQDYQYDQSSYMINMNLHSISTLHTRHAQPKYVECLAIYCCNDL